MANPRVRRSAAKAPAAAAIEIDPVAVAAAEKNPKIARSQALVAAEAVVARRPSHAAVKSGTPMLAPHRVSQLVTPGGGGRRLGGTLTG